MPNEPGAAAAWLAGAEAQGVRPIAFQKIDQYTSFAAEMAVEGQDLVVHFYLPGAFGPVERAAVYWEKVFPRVLDPVAKEVFEADYPALQAAYTEELRSWWLRAYGLGARVGGGGAEAIAAWGMRFFEALDQALDRAWLQGGRG